MKRRNFLKGLFGVAAIPSICTAKLPKSTWSKDIDINFDNININGTFNEWVESIRAEVERLLKPVNQDDEKYLVVVKPCDWGVKRSIPAKAVVIKDGYRVYTYFSLAEMEFNKHTKYRKKHLTRLIECRFIDMTWSINGIIQENIKLLKRFDPKYRVENYA